MYAEQRPNGKWIGRYRDQNGKLRSAGTYVTKQEATNAAKRAAARDAARQSDDHALMTLHDYFYDVFLKNTRIMKRTRLEYEAAFRNHIDPGLGMERLEDITARDIRSVTRPIIDKGQVFLAHRIKAILSSVFTMLMEDDYIESNPARNVRLPSVRSNHFQSLDPETFKKIVEYLPSPASKFFALFLVGSGVRFGEAIGIRRSDFDPTTKEIHVRRRVIRLSYKHTDGTTRHEIVEGTKSGKTRVVPLSDAMAEALVEHCDTYNIKDDEWLFPYRIMSQGTPIKVVVGDSWTNGLTTFVHGTHRSYEKGKCRCDLCKRARAEHIRMERVRAGKPYRASRDKSGVTPWETWDGIWRHAVKDAGMEWNPRTHDLRHAHATILLSSGVDIYEVQQRLGHASINTTEVYLHRVQSMKSQAAAAADVFLDQP